MNIVVAGIGTEVGKTVVSAILATALGADYWKPFQCGGESDYDTMRQMLAPARHQVFPPAYALKAPVSFHQAARLENVEVDPQAIILPMTSRTLIIEGVGGIFSPITPSKLSLDFLQSWGDRWVIVSKFYLGSINHTLLTMEALQRRQIPVAGLVFNGEPNLDSEQVIVETTQLPVLGRLYPEKQLLSSTIQRYAKQWLPQLQTSLL